MRKQSLFFNLLRILTPDELNKVISTSEGRKRFELSDLTSMILRGESIEKITDEDDEEDEGSAYELGQGNEDEEQKAKVLPFPGEGEISETGEGEQVQTLEQLVFQVGPDCNELLERYFNQFEKSEKKKVATSEFLYEQKSKTLESQKKLKGSEVMKLYQLTSKKTPTSSSLVLNEDGEVNVSDSMKGNLINKKFY